MDDQTLGRLERIDLREIWTTEAADFTPWLAQPNNVVVLADTLGLTLEVEAEEKFVGPFRADILCKDVGTDTWVLIENQLERTDHKHLGQLLTYAAGLQAVTVVWVAASFTDEHRATLDWLNKITDESFRFFGLEVELWRIGDSPAAPKFNIISKPNNWSRSIAKAAREIDDAELSETRIMWKEYWTAFNSALIKANGPISGHRKPRPQHWMSYSVGRSGFSLSAVLKRRLSKISAELYLSGIKAKTFFRLLEQQKGEIEQELGYPLEWEFLPQGQDCRIAIYYDGVNPDDKSNWEQQHEWLASHLNKMHNVLSPRIKELDADDWRPEGD